MECACINITHKSRCKSKVTKLCTTCRDKLCGGCAKNHHFHDTIVKIGQEPAG